MGGRIVHFGADIGVGGFSRRFKQAEAEACGHDAFDRAVDVGGGGEAGLDRGGKERVGAAAVQVAAGLDGQGGGGGWRIGEMVSGEDVVDGIDIRDDIALEAPLSAQDVRQEMGVGGTGHAIETLIGGHDRIGVAFTDAGLEGGQIGAPEVDGADMDVELMAFGLGAAVNGKVLGRGDGAEPLRIVALEAADEGDAEAAGEVGILAVGFLAPPPAGVTEDVDIGRPEVEAGVNAVQTRAEGLGVLGPRFDADGGGDVMVEIRVPGSGEGDGLGEDGGHAVACDAVEGFVPPVVGGDAEAFDGGGVLLQLLGLLGEGHACDEIIHACGDRKR